MQKVCNSFREDGGLNDALKLARRLIKYTKKDTDNTRQGDEARELTDLSLIHI